MYFCMISFSAWIRKYFFLKFKHTFTFLVSTITERIFLCTYSKYVFLHLFSSNLFFFFASLFLCSLKGKITAVILNSQIYSSPMTK